jgi:hypothetical protein
MKMKVKELSRDQIDQLKQDLVCEMNEAKGEGTSWSDLAYADDFVTDEEVFEKFANVEFVEEDFFKPTFC